MLCRRFAVSRSTLRQALEGLQRRGVVIAGPNRGTYVADDARTGRAREDVRVTEDGRAGRQPGDVPFRRQADSGEPWPRRAERPLVQEPAPPRRTANGSGVNGGVFEKTNEGFRRVWLSGAGSPIESHILGWKL